MEYKRGQAASPDEIKAWVKFLGSTIAAYKLEAENMANCDETGMDLTEMLRRTYCGEKAIIIIPDDRRRVSAMVAIAQNGFCFPNFFIFPGSPNNPVEPTWMDGAGPNAVGVQTESGYMDTATFR